MYRETVRVRLKPPQVTDSNRETRRQLPVVRSGVKVPTDCPPIAFIPVAIIVDPLTLVGNNKLNWLENV